MTPFSLVMLRSSISRLPYWWVRPHPNISRRVCGTESRIPELVAQSLALRRLCGTFFNDEPQSPKKPDSALPCLLLAVGVEELEGVDEAILLRFGPAGFAPVARFVNLLAIARVPNRQHGVRKGETAFHFLLSRLLDLYGALERSRGLVRLGILASSSPSPSVRGV